MGMAWRLNVAFNAGCLGLRRHRRTGHSSALPFPGICRSHRHARPLDLGMRSLAATILIAALIGGSALAAECPGGRSDALGTERVLVVAPKEHARIGTMQYPETLPLADKEVVLSFDDGPLPPYTDRVLETLAAECVKATFFMVVRQAHAYPATVRRVYNEGHTIASHSQTHPRIF